MSLSCSLEMSSPFGPTIFTIWRNRRKKWRPGIACCGMCCTRDLQLQWNHVSWFTGRVLHRWGTKCEQNVLMVCSTCLQVPPPIKWLAGHNSAKLYSPRFAVKGIFKKADGTWIDDQDWLRLNRPAEQLYLYQKAA
jgi:hypothetical protein